MALVAADELPCRVSDIGGFNQTPTVDKIEVEDDNGLLSHCVNVCLKMTSMLTSEPRRLASGMPALAGHCR